jgi:hypothetical protein
MADTSFRFRTCDPQPLITVHDAATFLGVGCDHISRWLDRGLLPDALVDGTCCVPAASVAQLYAARDGDVTAADVYADLCDRDQAADALDELARGELGQQPGRCPERTTTHAPRHPP